MRPMSTPCRRSPWRTSSITPCVIPITRASCSPNHEPGLLEMRRHAVLGGFEPARGTHAPAIACLQAGKTVFRNRRDEVVAAALRILQEGIGHLRADGMAADILRTGMADPIANEPGHRRDAAHMQQAAQHIERVTPPTSPGLND